MFRESIRDLHGDEGSIFYLGGQGRTKERIAAAMGTSVTELNRPERAILGARSEFGLTRENHPTHATFLTVLSSSSLISPILSM